MIAPKNSSSPFVPLGCGAHPSLPDLKQAIKDALAEGLEGVLGWKQGFDAIHAEPVFMTTPEEVDSLIWGPFNVHNLAVYLPSTRASKIRRGGQGLRQQGRGRAARRKSHSREEVKIFGMGCNGNREPAPHSGQAPRRREDRILRRPRQQADRHPAGGQEYEMTMAEVAQDKCRLCTKPNAVLSDVFVGNPTVEPAAPARRPSARPALPRLFEP